MNLSDLQPFLDSIGARFTLAFDSRRRWYCMLMEADYDWDRDRRTRQFYYGQAWAATPEEAIEAALRAFNADYQSLAAPQKAKPKPGITLSLEDLDL